LNKLARGAVRRSLQTKYQRRNAVRTAILVNVQGINLLFDLISIASELSTMPGLSEER
jgi:hypothetical protein